MSIETRIYIKGTSEAPKVRDWGGRPAVYKQFAPDDTLYYEKDGKYYCVVDDLSARGIIVKEHDGTERFLPHDYDDLVSYDEARLMCKQAGVYLPKPTHKYDGKRVPPPLFKIKTPTKNRFAWNRSAILRHIEESNKRKSNA